MRLARTLVAILVAIVIAIVAPAVAAAQEPVRDFGQLNTRLRPGDAIWVTDPQGREVEGAIGSRPEGARVAAWTAGGDRRLEWEPRARARAQSGSTQKAPGRCGNWICRHPVWFGMIVGAAGGAAIMGAAEGAEASPVGFYAGAGTGALAGWIVAATR